MIRLLDFGDVFGVGIVVGPRLEASALIAVAGISGVLLF